MTETETDAEADTEKQTDRDRERNKDRGRDRGWNRDRNCDTKRRVDWEAWRAENTVEKGKLGANAMKRVAAGAHLPTPWLFEPAKRPDDRADYCLDCSFLPQWKHRVLVFTLEWSGARLVGEQW